MLLRFYSYIHNFKIVLLALIHIYCELNIFLSIKQNLLTC